MSRVSRQFIRLPRRGFTLIELLIVIVVVGILLAVAIPSVGRTINSDRVSRSATVVQGMLDEASQLAVRRNTPVTVTLNNGALVITDRTTTAVLKRREFGPDQDLRATLAFTPAGGVTIFPNGRANADLTISLSGSGVTSVVTRTATGIVRRQ